MKSRNGVDKADHLRFRRRFRVVHETGTFETAEFLLRTWFVTPSMTFGMSVKVQ